jgi:molybdenum cofactor cytidylyltransferase
LSRMHYIVEQCAVVVLAAGMSSRFGTPKQLLAYHGKSLLWHTADVALQTGAWPVVVVVGANGVDVKKEIEGMRSEVVNNESWEEGIASSLRCGLTMVQKINPGADGIIFMVCDQPYVTISLLDCLLKAQHETGLPIVASSYQNNLGTPALFHKTFFGELMALKGDTGARNLIRQHEGLVTTVPFAKGGIDIDTRTDYEALLQ